MLSGTFVSRAFRPDPNQAVLHTADPAHADTTSVEADAVWHAPPYPEVTPQPEVVGLDWVTDDRRQTVDQTPVTHDGPAVPSTESEAISQGTLGDAHAVDAGADERVIRQPPPLQYSTERYESARFQGLGNEGIEPTTDALRRGLNADPINNPPVSGYGGEGFRRGYQDTFAVRRRFNPPPRFHEPRVVVPDTADTITVDAPPVAGDASVARPFGSLQRFLRTPLRPQMRREPPPWDQDVITATSDQASAQTVEAVGYEWVAG